ncbi:hypothetical protein, partial [Caballeronia choica]|uniref:hypothetical protein n=1 Tax=Caballeronia choica TaxID=326476 RepID=UPI001F27F4B2
RDTQFPRNHRIGVALVGPQRDARPHYISLRRRLRLVTMRAEQEVDRVAGYPSAQPVLSVRVHDAKVSPS